jgi:hypothetical protein
VRASSHVLTVPVGLIPFALTDKVWNGQGPSHKP